MWAVIKINKNCLSFLKKEFKDKLGNDVKYFYPKLKLKKFYKKKSLIKEISLLGDYILCFHEGFKKSSIINTLKYCKGLKYFLSDFANSQADIENFIVKCKKHEDNDGFLKPTFFEINKKIKFEFTSGPFTNLVFRVLYENKLSISALIGNYKITVSKEQNFFRPV